jgi:hypothetical protein
MCVMVPSRLIHKDNVIYAFQRGRYAGGQIYQAVFMSRYNSGNDTAKYARPR